MPRALSADTSYIGSIALALSANGTVQAAWDDGEEVFHAYGAPTITSAPTTVAYGDSVALAGGSVGSAHLAFTALVGDWYDVYTTDWNGVSWTLPALVMPTDEDSGSPAITWAQNKGAVAWADNGAEFGTLYLAQSLSGQPWTAYPVEYAWGDAPDVCLQSWGTGLLFQSPHPQTERLDILYSQYNGVSWTLPLSISDTSDAYAASAGTLACSGSQPHAAWQQESASGYHIYYAERSAGNWSTPALVSGATQAFGPDLTAGPDGSLHLAWAGPQSVSYRRRLGGIWGAIETLNRAPNLVTDVTVAVAPDGTVHLAWVEVTGSGLSRVMYSVRTSEPLPTPTPTPSYRRYMPVIFRSNS